MDTFYSPKWTKALITKKKKMNQSTSSTSHVQIESQFELLLTISNDIWKDSLSLSVVYLEKLVKTTYQFWEENDNKNLQICIAHKHQAYDFD